MSNIPQKKRGRLSKEEEKLILGYLPSMTDEEIATVVGKSADLIAKFRAEAPLLQNEDNNNGLILQLHRKFFWKEIQNQLLDAEEISYFEQHWASMYSQFIGQGVVATDELMIRDLIMTDIQVNRIMKEKRDISHQIQETEDDIDFIRTNEDPLERQLKLDVAYGKLNQIRTAAKAINDQWIKLQEKKDKKYEQLKATREQRYERAEKSNRSWGDLVKLLDTPEVRDREGRFNEIHKAAAELARLRFHELTVYEDGKIDRPALTPEGELEHQRKEKEDKEK